MKHGHVRLSGVGMIKLRGKARTPGEAKTGEVLHKSGQWYLSVTVECTPQRTCGDKAAGMDWGVETFVTLAETGDHYASVANPRFMDKPQRQRLKRLQQSVSRKTNLRSQNRRKAVKALATEYRKIANRSPVSNWPRWGSVDVSPCGTTKLTSIPCKRIGGSSS